MKNRLQNMWRVTATRKRLVLAAVILVAIVLSSLFLWRMLEPGATTIPAPAHWPTSGWHISSPETEGFDSVKLAQGLQAIQQNHIRIHSLMVVRNGEVFLDAYFYPYDGSTYHDLASVTKSVVATLIGIAADQDRLDLDEPILSFFPNRTIANRDALKERITVRHLLSMTSGLSCTAIPEERTLEEMMARSDWVQFALDRPMASEPGTRFVYDSPGMHLLSAILQQATGMTALDYAKENLFKPLGITEVFWLSDPQGYSRGWGALSLHPRDAAKIGLLFLQHGQWESKQLVSSEWVADATIKQSATGSYKAEDYGYGWWISRREDLVYFRADGGNGQRILVIPSMNLVLVTTGGGFELDEVIPYVEAAIVDLQKPLPENPAGVAQLEAAVKKCKQPPAAKPVPPLPDTAHAISTKTFIFETNLVQVRSIRLDFNDSAAAILHMDVAMEANPRVAGIGLDGVYRPSVSGRPSVALGTWTDAQTFTIDYNEGPGITYHTFLMRFDGDRMTFEIAGLVTLEGKLA